MNYRMTGSLPMMALYRCEHCHKVALHQVTLKKRTSYDSTWTQSGLERRRSRKQEELSGKLDKAAAQLSSGSGALTFLGKTIEGKCPHCQKKQAWMRMSYSLWGSLMGVLAFMAAVGAFCIYTFEGNRAQLFTMQQMLSFIIAALVLLAAGWVIHAVTMLLHTRWIAQESPIYLARTVAELAVKAAEHPDYMAEIRKSQNEF